MPAFRRVGRCFNVPSNPKKLWYKTPAKVWTEALPWATAASAPWCWRRKQRTDSIDEGTCGPADRPAPT